MSEPSAAPAPEHRANLEIWSAISSLLVCVTVGAVVIATHLLGHQTIVGPVWVWVTIYLGFLGSLVLAGWADEMGPLPWMPFVIGAHVLAGWATVLLTFRAGWTPILLVFAAGIVGYYVGVRGAALVVAGNSVVIVASVALGGGGVFDLLFTAVIYLFLQLSVVMFVLNEQRLRATRDALAAAHVELRATSALLTESSRTAERLRIARELHDVIGHQLTALTLELEVATHHATGPAGDHVSRARQLAKDLLADVRSTVGGLRATTPELLASLQAVTADLPNLEVHLEVADDLQVTDDTVAALVRCVQEIVTNAIRHAQARNVWIELRAGDGATVLTARDDGRGVADLRVGNGLKGMRERIEQLGGTIAFSSDAGFRVVAQVPAS